MSKKNPLIPAGIEPATFRFVAQHLNHCATAVPAFVGSYLNFIVCFDVKLILFLRDSKMRFLKVFLYLLESTFITVVVYKLFSEDWVIKPKHRLLVWRVSNNAIPQGKFSLNLIPNITPDMQTLMLRYLHYGPC